MKKKSIVSLIVLSLFISLAIWYRVNYVTQIRSWESNALAVIIGLTAITMLIIAYKELLKRFSKGHLVKENYAVLFDLEAKHYTGEIEFYFTLDEPKNLVFSILSDKMVELLVVKEGNFETGGHIVRFDTSSLESGYYFYCLKTDNQRTMKKVLILHDIVTA